MSADEPPGVRYALSAGPGDVGHRVVLRHRLADGRLSDVLGHVERWSGGTVTVRDRHGALVEVEESLLVAAKRVPDPPARRVTTRDRFAEAVRSRPVDLGLACLLVGGEVDPELDVDGALAVLDGLAAAARPHVPPGCAPHIAAGGLRRVLGTFAGGPEDYDDVRSSLLHEVLRRRRGLPLTLSVLWVEVARRLGVVAEPVALPGHVVVAIGHEDVVHVDAFAGGEPVPVEALAARVRGATGVPLRPQDLDPADPLDLLLRLLTNVRALAARSDNAIIGSRTRLWAVELSLLLPRHPVALRAEHGELLVRLGDHVGGAAELEAYADAVEGADEPAAGVARRQARLARARLN